MLVVSSNQTALPFFCSTLMDGDYRSLSLRNMWLGHERAMMLSLAYHHLFYGVLYEHNWLNCIGLAWKTTHRNVCGYGMRRGKGACMFFAHTEITHHTVKCSLVTPNTICGDNAHDAHGKFPPKSRVDPCRWAFCGGGRGEKSETNSHRLRELHLAEFSHRLKLPSVTNLRSPSLPDQHRNLIHSLGCLPAPPKLARLHP